MRAASRRMTARIRHAALTSAPIWFSRGRLAAVQADRCPTIMQRNIVLPELPEPLDGLKITHLSDLHIGELTTPAHLPQIIECCRKAGGDLIAITGDFVDLSLRVLDPLIEALKQLEAPLGVYMVPGNHDYLEDGPTLVRRFREAGLGLLLNESVSIDANKCRITIAGVDWEEKPQRLARLVQHTMHHALGNGQAHLKLLLAHHPDAFDEACRYGVDLTLSGHTHGGQVVFTEKRGKKGCIGLGSLAFRYPRGLYRRGDRYLYVTSGVGSWFPLRVNCPAEIAQLTLRSTVDSTLETSHP